MSWVKIKRAVNSTLGTKEFKPLDQIIKGQKTLVASDNLYTHIGTPNALWSIDRTTADSLKIPYSVKMNTSGSMRLFFQGSYTDQSYPGQVKVYKNNVLQHTMGLTYDYTGYLNMVHDFTFNKNDVFSFELSGSTYTVARIRNLQIRADIVDGSLLEITNESEE